MIADDVKTPALRRGRLVATAAVAGASLLMLAALFMTQRLQSHELWLSGAALVGLLAAYAITLLETRRRGEAQFALVESNASLASQVKAHTASLQESEQRYRRLVELSADAIVLCGPDRAILYANPAALRLMRCGPPDGLNGRLVESMFGAEDQASLTAWLDLLWDSPRQHAYRDASLVNADGARVAVRVAAVSYLDASAMRAQIVMHDVTELEAKENAALEQLRFIDQLLDAIPTPLSVRDQRGRYVRVNRAYELMYQCKRATIRGRSVFDMFPYDVAGRLAQWDSEAMRSVGALDYEFDLALPHVAASKLQARACAVRRSDDSVIAVITVDTDVSQMHLKEAQLAEAHASLEALYQKLLRSQEDERRRIGRDLHDQVGQILTALKMSLQMLGQRLPIDADALAPILDLAEDALVHARSLTASLHPHILEDLGLEAAAGWLLDHYVRPAVMNVSAHAALQPARSTPEHELVAFRLLQESLTNVIRHANATVVQIRLEAEDHQLSMVVTDNGEGFEAGTTRFGLPKPSSLGIASMRERVAEVGGDLHIESAPGRGTAVRAVLPW